MKKILLLSVFVILMSYSEFTVAQSVDCPTCDNNPAGERWCHPEAPVEGLERSGQCVSWPVWYGQEKDCNFTTFNDCPIE